MPQTLRGFLRHRVNRIEKHREVQIRDKLLKTLIGKLSKKDLVEEQRAKTAG